MSDKIKTLSQAIRLGAMFRPQGKHMLFCRATQTTCALGAAMEAVGLLDLGTSFQPLLDDFYTRFQLRFDLVGEIQLWNDKDELTREQIADRLEARGL